MDSRLEALLDKHKLNYEIKWILSGMPFLTAKGDLVDAAVSAITDRLRTRNASKNRPRFDDLSL